MRVVGSPSRSIDEWHVDHFKVIRLKVNKRVTVNIELRTLRSALYTALRWKLIDESLFAGVKLLRIPDKQPVIIGKADFVKVVSLVREGLLKEPIVFAVATGMRRSEILNLH